MKPLIITAAVAVAAIGGAGAAFVAGAWPGAPTPPQVAPLAVVAPAAENTGDPVAAAAPEPATPAPTAAAAATSAAATPASGPATQPAAAAGGSSPDSAGTTGQSTAAPPAATTERACGLGPWDRRVQGAPAGFSGGDRAGDYLWHDAAGFHLRVTHRGDRKDVFTGAITSDRALALAPVRLEGRDAVTLSADRRTIVFRFYDYGHIDGVDVVTDCATRLVVGDLRLDGGRLGVGRVYLGHGQVHPAQVPFQLTRPAG